MSNPYRSWVDGIAESLRAGARIGTAPSPAVPAAAEWAEPTALIFSPHPDDEVIIGGLPLRLQRECGVSIVNVAVTLGARADRREARWRELQAACAALGFRLVTPDRHGLENITLDGRVAPGWRDAVVAVARLIEAERPRFVFLPHAADWHRTHIGVHALVTEAMAAVAGLACFVIETEFWGAMADPNLMIESSSADVADLVAALSLHVGEVARNPYHLRLPAWMIDNVRRGAELLGGQGGAAPDVTFATLYRLRRWEGGALQPAMPGGRCVGAAERLDPLFEADAWR